jgi:LPS-assembly protein
MRLIRLLTISSIILSVSAFSFAQQTNPVDREVTNPITDTPNINPVAPERSVVAPNSPRPTPVPPEGGDGEVVVYSDRQSVSGPQDKRVLIHQGGVDIRFGIYRLQADKVTIHEEENRLEAEGNVIFDQGADQRITGVRASWNYRTKLGWFEDSTGFTNQTNDGTIIYFTADRVEKKGANELVITNGEFTACDEATPKWSFKARRAKISLGDKVKLRKVRFLVKGVPLIPAPYASIPIKRQDRSSGFLTPGFGYSQTKGARLSGAYFQTLGESADVTVRTDIYSARGLGYGLDFRTRSNSRSYFNFGFYAVKDRIFGKRADAQNPDQGGSIVYAEGVQYFSNGFTAAADVRLTSSLAFRQVFSDGIQQIISPIEVSQVFVNKSWGNYTLDVLARSQVISIPNVRIKTRNLPSISFEKRPSILSFLDGMYFSFRTNVEGVSRREQVDNVALYQQLAGGPPIETPALVQRFDVYPQFTYPFRTKYFNFTATAGGRVTYYSNSLDPLRRMTGRDVMRKYGEFEFDVRPVALAKNYYTGDKFRFRHVIEPFLTYRLLKGIDAFERIIRFDHIDTATNTNEIEFGVSNRLYSRRYSEAVTDSAREALEERPNGTEKDSLAVQPYEFFSLTVRGKYFLDKDFGGTLVPGRRHQIEPITALSFYTFGGVPRRFSPLNIDATYRPQRTVFVNARVDLGLNGDGLRAASATVGYDTKLLKIFQTVYYTRAVTLKQALAQYANAAGKEPGTLRGSQWSPSVFVGDRDRGLYGGTSLFFDFENRRQARQAPLISSLYTIGYAYDCCSLALQYYRFNVGLRQENRFIFSFRLNGIGAIGTESFAQGLR